MAKKKSERPKVSKSFSKAGDFRVVTARPLVSKSRGKQAAERAITVKYVVNKDGKKVAVKDVAAHILVDSIRVGKASRKSTKIVIPPGTQFGRMLSVFMTPAAYRRWVYPSLAEMQQEYFEALAAGRVRYARWVVIRGLFYLVPGWVYGLFFGTLKDLFKSP